MEMGKWDFAAVTNEAGRRWAEETDSPCLEDFLFIVKP